MLLGAPRLLSIEEKRHALALVLASHTFARCDQLKAFLEYVCTQEISGKGGDLNEYLVGVEVLGRPEGYSTGEDSTVRSRAHALRRKLQDFYASEMPQAPVRIDLPKGSYCPRFLAVEPETPAAPPVDGQAGGTAAAVTPSRRAAPVGWFAGAAVAAAALFWAGLYVGRPADPVDPVIREAWGPLLSPDANVIVCVSTPPQLLVRQRPPGAATGGMLPVPENLDLSAWHSQRQSLAPGNRLYYLPHHHSPLWGDVAGAMSVLHTLARAGASYQIVPERVGEPFILRDRNVILLGRPEYSRAAALLLEQAYYHMDFDGTLSDEALWYVEPGSASRRVMPKTKGYVHGLVTILRSEGASGHRRRTVVISGVNSAGSQAAAEYFASPESLRQLRTRLRREGHTSWPQAWQVVIRAHEEKTLPLSFSYVVHRVLSR